MRLTEALYPGYIVALAPAGTYKLPVLHIINRGLIADTVMHRPLSDFNFEGTLRALATTIGSHVEFAGLAVNAETYAFGSGSSFITLDDSRPIKIETFSGNMRSFFTVSALACKPQAVVLWRSITGKGAANNAPVRLEILPDGGGDRSR